MASLLISATGLDQQLQRLQASFISNFPAYVKWPRGTVRGNELRIGLIGPDPLGKAGRQYLRGRYYGPLQYNVQQVQKGEAANYDILYIDGLDEKETKALLKEVKDKPILTVGMHPDFLSWGGIVNFQVKNRAVRFQVSFSNAKKAGLIVERRLATYGQTM